MMTKMEMMNLSKPLADLYKGLETDLIVNIAQWLKNGDINASTPQWKMKLLAQLGALDKTNIRLIAEYAELSPDMVTDVLEQAALTAISELEPGFQKLAKEGIINNTEVPIEKTMENAVKAYQKQAKNSLNMVNTVMRYKAKSTAQKLVNDIAELSEKQTFLNMLNKATGKVVTGAESRQAAVRQCIKEMSEKGIPAFVDKKGREWSPEAYINMDIRTTANNVAHKAQFNRMDDYEIDLIEVSSHSGARPKCADDQGKIFNCKNKDGYTTDLNGRKIKYYSWKKSSYGEPDGILGINCGHHIYPFIPGVSYQTYFPYDEYDNQEEYKKLQTQRELERRVRRSKHECTFLETLGDSEGLKKAKVKLRERQAKLKRYCNDNNLKYKPDRTAVQGYNKTTAGFVSNAEKQKLEVLKNKLLKSVDNSAGSGIIKERPYEIVRSREERLKIIKRGISEPKPIFAVDTQNNKFASYVKNIAPKKEFYDVALHGAPTSAEFFGERIDAYTLASIIRNRKDYTAGTKVRLLSCSTGNTDETGDCFAQLLANELGVEVEAPTEMIWVNENGDFSIYNNDFSKKGIMKLFYSRKYKEE